MRIRLWSVACGVFMLPAVCAGDPGKAPAPAAAPEAIGHRPTFRVAGIVLKWLVADKEANFRRGAELIRQAAAEGAQMVCTTECFLDGYAVKGQLPADQFRSLGEPIPGGAYYERLAELARELNIYLVAGMSEADGEHRYNTAAVISPAGELVGKWRKHEIGGEAGQHTPGSGDPVFSTPYGRLGLVICRDRRYPELVERLCAHGAEFILCPSGGMFGPARNDHFLQSRSKENHIPIVFVHPAEFLVTGPDGSIRYRVLLGDRLKIAESDVGADPDQNGVFFYDLPVSPSAAAASEK